MNKPRLRVGTIMLLIVILALCMALGIHQRRAAHREAELQRRAAAREAELRARIAEMEQDDLTRWKQMSDRRVRHTGSAIPPAANANARGPYRFPFPPAE